MTHDEANAWHPEIHGWSTDLLPYYARTVPLLPEAPRIVEVGVHHGRSLLFLAERLIEERPGARLWGVDPLEWNEEQWPSLLRHCVASPGCPIVRILRCPSIAASHAFSLSSLDMVFIDGEHDYASVLTDIHAWLPVVKMGGLLCGHDYGDSHPGVRKAVDEAFGRSVTVYGSCWEVRV